MTRRVCSTWLWCIGRQTAFVDVRLLCKCSALPGASSSIHQPDKLLSRRNVCMFVSQTWPKATLGWGEERLRQIVGHDLFDVVTCLFRIFVISHVVQVALISPLGTRTVLLSPRLYDESKTPFTDWGLTTVQLYGEVLCGVFLTVLFRSWTHGALAGATNWGLGAASMLTAWVGA